MLWKYMCITQYILSKIQNTELNIVFQVLLAKSTYLGLGVYLAGALIAAIATLFLPFETKDRGLQVSETEHSSKIAAFQTWQRPFHLCVSLIISHLTCVIFMSQPYHFRHKLLFYILCLFPATIHTYLCSNCLNAPLVAKLMPLSPSLN